MEYDSTVENHKLRLGLELLELLTGEATLRVSNDGVFSRLVDQAHTMMVDLTINSEAFIRHTDVEDEYDGDLEIRIDIFKWLDTLKLWEDEKVMDVIWKIRKDDLTSDTDKRIPTFADFNTSLLHTRTDSGHYDRVIPLYLEEPMPSKVGLDHDVVLNINKDTLKDFFKGRLAKDEGTFFIVFDRGMLGADRRGVAIIREDMDKDELIDSIVIYEDQMDGIDRFEINKPLVSKFNSYVIAPLFHTLNPKFIPISSVKLKLKPEYPMVVSAEYADRCYVDYLGAPWAKGDERRLLRRVEILNTGDVGTDFNYELDGNVLYEIGMLKQLISKNERIGLKVEPDHILLTYSDDWGGMKFKTKIPHTAFELYSPDSKDYELTHLFDPDDLWSVIRADKKGIKRFGFDHDRNVWVIELGDNVYKEVKLTSVLENDIKSDDTSEVMFKIRDGSTFKKTLSKFRKVDDYEGTAVYSDLSGNVTFYAYTEEKGEPSPVQLTYKKAKHVFYEWYGGTGTDFIFEVYPGDSMYKALKRVMKGTEVTIAYGLYKPIHVIYDVKDIFELEVILRQSGREIKHEEAYPSIEMLYDFEEYDIKEVLKLRNKRMTGEEPAEVREEEPVPEVEDMKNLKDRYEAFVAVTGWRDDEIVEDYKSWKMMYDKSVPGIDKAFKEAKTDDKKFEVLRMMRFVYPELTGYFDRICLPFEDAEGKNRKKTIRCWWDALKKNIAEFGTFEAVYKDIKAYYKSLEEIADKRREELYDEGYADAEAEMKKGVRLDEMNVDYHTDASKAWYAKGWNMAIEDYKKKSAVKEVMIDDMSDSEVREMYQKALKLMKTGDTRIGHPMMIADEFMATDIAEDKKYYYKDWGNDHIRGFKQPTVDVMRDVLRWLQRDHSELWERLEEREAPAEEPEKENLILEDIDMVTHDDYGLGMIYTYSKSKDRRRYEINFPEFHQRKDDTNRVWSDDPKLKLVKRTEEMEKNGAIKEWYRKWREGEYPITEENAKLEEEAKTLLDKPEKPAIDKWDNIYVTDVRRLPSTLYSELASLWDENIQYATYNRVRVGTRDPMGYEMCEKYDLLLEKTDQEPLLDIHILSEYLGQSESEVAEALHDLTEREKRDTHEWMKKVLKVKRNVRPTVELLIRERDSLIKEAKKIMTEEEKEKPYLKTEPTPEPEPEPRPPTVVKPKPKPKPTPPPVTAKPKLSMAEQKRYDEGYSTAKDYLDEGVEINIRDPDPQIRGKTGVAYDMGWNKAIHSEDMIDAEYVDVPPEEEEPEEEEWESEAVKGVKLLREKMRDIPIEELCEHVEPDDDITSLINIVNRFDTAEEFTDILSTDRRRPFARITAILGYGEHRDTLSDACKGALLVGTEEVECYAKQHIDCGKDAVWVYRGSSTIKAGDFVALDYDVAVREGKPVYCARISLEDIVWTGLHEAEWYYVPKHLQEEYKDDDGKMFFEKHKIVEEPEEVEKPEPDEPEVEGVVEAEVERVPENESLMLQALEANADKLELPADKITDIEKETERLERELEEYLEYVVKVDIEVDDRDMYIIPHINPQYKEVFDRDPQTVYHSVENISEEERLKILGEAIEEFINEIRESRGREPTDVYVKELDLPGRGVIPVRPEEEIASMAEDLGVETEYVTKGKDFLKRMIDTDNRVLMNPYRDAAVIEIIGLDEDRNMIRASIDKWFLGGDVGVTPQTPSFKGRFPMEVVDDLVAYQFLLPPDQIDNLKSAGYDIEKILKDLKDELVIVTRSGIVGAKVKF